MAHVAFEFGESGHARQFRLGEGAEVHDDMARLDHVASIRAHGPASRFLLPDHPGDLRPQAGFLTQPISGRTLGLQLDETP